jgi:oxalate decarboxylase/phosphoglucose isomerase-like protein (cupin superfamily)
MKSRHRLVYLPKITDSRGNLSFIEGDNHIPFAIKRAYWIYDVPGGEIRGGHAFYRQQEFIVALSGSFDVKVESNGHKSRIQLNRSYFGLYVPPGTWRSMENFSTNSIALVLASSEFDGNDYIRDYEKFRGGILNDPPAAVKPDVSAVHLSGQPVDSRLSTVDDCRVLELDKNHRIKGNMTVVENFSLVPFPVSRVYYLYDVPGGEARGGHAHRELSQLIIAAGGSFDVILDDGITKRTFSLNRPYQALYVVPGIWRELVNFSSGSTCLVLASHNYSESDYIRDYTEFGMHKISKEMNFR